MAELFTLPLLTDAAILGYYRFEGNSTDSSGEGNDGTDTSMTYGAAKYGSGAIFDGSNSMIDIAGIAITQNFSFAAWINITDTATTRLILDAPANGVEWYLTSDEKLNIAKNGVAVMGTSTSACPTGSLQHVGVTYDGTTLRFYLNGAADGTPTSTQTFSANIVDIGHAATASKFAGTMDDLVIANREFTAAEMLSLYQESVSGGYFFMSS